MTTAKELSAQITKAMEGVPMTKNGISTASALADAERRAEAAEAKLANRWLDIDEQATSGERILLLWKPFGGMKEHVELGRFSQSATGWVNTYGKPFSTAPDKWAPLAPFSPTPASDIAALMEALERIAEASPRSTNSWSAEEAFSWCAAVAETALENGALQHIAKGER